MADPGLGRQKGSPSFPEWSPALDVPCAPGTAPPTCETTMPAGCDVSKRVKSPRRCWWESRTRRLRLMDPPPGAEQPPLAVSFISQGRFCVPGSQRGRRLSPYLDSTGTPPQRTAALTGDSSGFEMWFHRCPAPVETTPVCADRPPPTSPRGLGAVLCVSVLPQHFACRWESK